jgi:FkbM family methyltransferase
MRGVEALGAITRAARRAGLEPAIHGIRDLLDVPFVRIDRPPLTVKVEGLTLRGFLRHRSALADLARPGTTYAGLFTSSLRRDMTVVDAGAHLGLYALLAARAGANVLAFEPDPYNLRALKHNAATARIQIVPKALADGSGRATFYRSGGTIGSSLNRRGPSDRETIVELTSLDEELRGIELSSLLVKLNIEGAELRALEGMQETLARCREATMFVEVNPEVLRRPQDLVSRLRELGFEVSWIDRATQALVSLDASAPLGKGHLFACRSER